ncbi:MAG: hypothetical protein HDR74_06865 [Bacteroides sp.]|nr:hypothetical protein [Bacteroides sp.]
MNAISYFDAVKYFEDICKKNRLAQEHKFQFCTCSGIETLQEPLDKFRTTNAFFCVDDTNDGALFRGRAGGWYKKRTFTVFLMHRYTFNDMKQYAERIGWCRELLNQIVSKLIIDVDDLSNDMVYLDTGNILCREFGQYVLNGCTGLYFMVDVTEPVDLTFKAEQWQA